MTRLQAARRGEMSSGELVGLILVIVSIALIAFLLTSIRPLIDESANKSCAAAVRDAHLTNTYFGRDFSKEITACQPHLLTIKRDKLPADPAKAENETKRLLAEQMRKCWQDWGGGELNLFKDEGEYCHTCAIISFDEKARTEIAELEDFNVYLANTKAPGLKNVTYAAMLRGYASPSLGLSGLKNDPYDLPLDRDLGIFFYYSKTKQASSAYDWLTGTALTPGQTALASGSVGGVVVAGAAVLTLPFSVTGGALLVGGTALASYVVSLVNDGADDYYILSATYITQNTPDNPYVQDCTRAAATTVSP